MTWISILPPNRTNQEILDFLTNPDFKVKGLLKILIEMNTISRDELKKLNQWKRNQKKSIEVEQNVDKPQEEINSQEKKK